MTGSLRALALLTLSIALAGCANLPFFGKDEAAPQPGSAAADAPQVALYDLDVEAPGALKRLLLDFLDLSRFQKAPADAAISGPELDRLVAAAPAQARSLLETEGYFDPVVDIEQTPEPGGLVRITMRVEPGPRVRIGSVAIDAVAPLAVRRPTRDDRKADRLERMRENWALKPGEPFRESSWSSAKAAALGELRGDGYPTASWRSTRARVDASEEKAALELTVDGGPLYHFGAVRVEGIQRYEEAAVRRLSTFRLGDVYSEKAMLDYQERLIKSGLFEGASVDADVETGPPEATVVSVKVRELPQHQATFGIGYSANTGGRVSVDHYNRRVFGWPWIAHSNVVFGSELKSIGTELTSYPREDLSRNLAAVNLERLETSDETRDSAALRAGRSQDTGRHERVWFGELSRARVQSSRLSTTSDAATLHYQWLRRHVDSVLLPTRGAVLSLQGAAGYGDGTQTRSDRPGTEKARGPFLRTYARINAYEPVGEWFLNGRLEIGQVFVKNRIAVPDPLLFRAGGDNSVRGYAFRDLGPEVNRALVGGRVLMTASLEAEHPIVSRLPSLLGAVFIDAGNAADRWGEMRPVVGYGVGVHYRSPVGPLRLDVAYGHQAQKVRLHLSVGVAF